MSEKYVVIAEYKNDEPLVHETYLRVTFSDEAERRMRELKASPNVIRVAIAKLEYSTGNRSLLEG